MSFILAEEKALRAKLQGLTVEDRSQAERPVTVWYANPDETVVNRDFPYIEIRLVDVRRSAEREHRGRGDMPYIPDVPNWEPTPDDHVTVADFAVPYDLYFEVVSNARNNRESRVIQAQLMTGPLRDRYGYLHIPEDSTIRRLDIMQPWQSLGNRDEHGKRIFTGSSLIRVSSEIPDPEVLNSRIVESVALTVELI